MFWTAAECQVQATSTAATCRILLVLKYYMVRFSIPVSAPESREQQVDTILYIHTYIQPVHRL
jgi:hypothetical protein